MAKLDQDAITETAIALIELDSHDELTLAAIARRLDVTQPALYYHVAGLDSVLRLVGLAVRRRLYDALSEATIGRSGADAVREVARAWRTFSQEHPGLYRSTDWYPIAGDEELEQSVHRVLSVLAASLRSFHLDGSAAAGAALALRSALHGFCSFELGAGNPSVQSPDESFAAVIDLILAGIDALHSSSEVASTDDG